MYNTQSPAASATKTPQPRADLETKISRNLSEPWVCFGFVGFNDMRILYNYYLIYLSFVLSRMHLVETSLPAGGILLISIAYKETSFKAVALVKREHLQTPRNQ